MLRLLFYIFGILVFGTFSFIGLTIYYYFRNKRDIKILGEMIALNKVTNEMAERVIDKSLEDFRKNLNGEIDDIVSKG
jgi:choline-glycine betaine transporter